MVKLVSLYVVSLKIIVLKSLWRMLREASLSNKRLLYGSGSYLGVVLSPRKFPDTVLIAMTDGEVVCHGHRVGRGQGFWAASLSVQDSSATKHSQQPGGLAL